MAQSVKLPTFDLSVVQKREGKEKKDKIIFKCIWKNKESHNSQNTFERKKQNGRNQSTDYKTLITELP